MAVAFTQTKRSVYGTDRVVYGSLVFSGNYATGGEAVTPATFGLTRLDLLIFDGIAVSTDLTAGLGLKYNAATGKIAAYETAGTVDLAFKEVSNSQAYAAGTNVSCIAIGA